MRQITTHHDGHGLNESINLTADDRDPNGGCASHSYQAVMPHLELGNSPGVVLKVQFQQGPRHELESKPGVTEAVLYAVLIDRLEGFQAGPYACPENEAQLSALRGCLASTKARADERAARAVLGTYQK